MKRHLILATAAFALVACSESPAPETVRPETQDPAPEVVEETINQAVMAEPVEIQIDAPAGTYKVDPNHASLHFSVKHLGVSNYVMRFTDFDVTVELNPDDLQASSVSMTIDPASIRTDFPGDYKGTHPDSPFDTWDQNLAKGGDFLNADEYPAITFTSTSVEPTDEGALHVTGDLELRGETQPVTLEVSVVGSAQAHPLLGVGLIGFSATGAFERSDFGLTHLLEPALVSDTVTLHFEGEFLQEQQGADSEQEDAAPEQDSES